MKFKRETMEIECGRKLYRYIFEAGSDATSETFKEGNDVDTSDSENAQEEPKGTSDEQGGR